MYLDVLHKMFNSWWGDYGPLMNTKLFNLMVGKFFNKRYFNHCYFHFYCLKIPGINCNVNTLIGQLVRFYKLTRYS